MRRRMNPVTSNFILTQSAREHICRKYDCGFNFYQAKSINQIVFNRRSEEITLAAKDIAVFVEQTEYLKRYYSSRNTAAKDEIKDRLLLLSNFYATADLLKYEYPMMIITRTEHIFTRRHKRITKINQEVGSSDSEQSEIEEDREMVNEQTLLESMDWSDLITDHPEIEPKPQRKRRPSFQYEQYSIYGDELQKKTEDFLRKMGRLPYDQSVELVLDDKINAKQVNHLVLDFDDLDREEVLNQFKKLADKENIPNRKSFIREEMRDSPFKLTGLIDKKPLSSSITISPLEPVASNETRRNPNNLNRQSMLLGSREQRDQQMKIMKKSSQYETQGRKKYVFPEDLVIDQTDGDESPLVKDFTKRLQLNPIFEKEEYHPDKTKEQKNTQPFNFVKKADGIKNIYGRSLMKQSQIQLDGFLSKDRFRLISQTNKVNEELNRLKQKPIEFKQVPLKIERMGKDRLRENKIQPKEKQKGVAKDIGNPPSNGFNYGHTEARGTKIKEGELQFRRVQSQDHFKFSPDRGWYEDIKGK